MSYAENVGSADAGVKTTDSLDIFDVQKTSDSCQQNSNRLIVSTDTSRDSRIHRDVTKHDSQTAPPSASEKEDAPGEYDITSANTTAQAQTAGDQAVGPRNIIRRNKVCISYSTVAFEIKIAISCMCAMTVRSPLFSYTAQLLLKLIHITD